MNDTASSLPAARILCVDDEPMILSALKRVFRPIGYTIFTANSGREGLELLEKEAVDLVISDMRMPEMDGAQFLEQVFKRWPDTKRILLTGYADAGATIAAINQGKIWRYVAKPWDENELILTVSQALAHRQLMVENARLFDLIQAQNAELKELNANLEAKVTERTEKLRETLASLESAHRELKMSFLTMVQVLTNLFELHSRRLAGHSRRVADTARQLARALGADETETQDILLAALLHDIGKFGQPEHMLGKSFQTMTPEERTREMHHPQRGQMVLMGINQLQSAATLVRHHHERFDGNGFPDHLAGLAIPLGARIIAVANDFDSLQMGTLVSRALKPAEARAFILENRGKRYDPSVVDAFLAHVADRIPEEIQELPTRPTSLKPGMVLTRDLAHPDGYLLLAKGQVVDDTIIKQLLKIESAEGHPLTLFIQPEQK
ncbi:MAG: response regulator [Rhodocyclaceae bacterium]|nr:response regulator [Rhodocyclaceae bacterium]